MNVLQNMTRKTLSRFLFSQTQ